MNTVTRSRSHLYALLLCMVALASYLSTNDWFKATVPPWAQCAIGALSVIAITYRAYLDDSSSRVPPPGSTTETASIDVTKTTTPPVDVVAPAPHAPPADTVPVTGGVIVAGETEGS